jgi:hypothetical protein
MIAISHGINVQCLLNSWSRHGVWYNGSMFAWTPREIQDFIPGPDKSYKSNIVRETREIKSRIWCYRSKFAWNRQEIHGWVPGPGMMNSSKLPWKRRETHGWSHVQDMTYTMYWVQASMEKKDFCCWTSVPCMTYMMQWE